MTEKSANTLNQKSMILQYMRENGGITQAEATRELGCYRLGARIWDLKHDGYEILKVDRETVNRFGRVSRFAEYRLIQGGQA